MIFWFLWYNIFISFCCIYWSPRINYNYFLLERSILIASKLFPVPVTYWVLLWIKNGQSLPSLFDSFNISFLLNLLKLLFKKFRIDEPSDEPPPNPAPIGIFLWRWILNFLSESNVLIALLTMLFDFFPSILIPDILKLFLLLSLISIIS